MVAPNKVVCKLELGGVGSRSLAYHLSVGLMRDPVRLRDAVGLGDPIDSISKSGHGGSV